MVDQILTGVSIFPDGPSAANADLIRGAVLQILCGTTPVLGMQLGTPGCWLCWNVGPAQLSVEIPHDVRVEPTTPIVWRLKLGKDMREAGALPLVGIVGLATAVGLFGRRSDGNWKVLTLDADGEPTVYEGAPDETNRIRIERRAEGRVEGDGEGNATSPGQAQAAGWTWAIGVYVLGHFCARHKSLVVGKQQQPQTSPTAAEAMQTACEQYVRLYTWQNMSSGLSHTVGPR